KRLVVPSNVVLHFLPPCTPELQPAEPLWPLVREAVANRSIGRVDRLRSVVRTRLGTWRTTPTWFNRSSASTGLALSNSNLSTRFGISRSRPQINAERRRSRQKTEFK